MSDAWDGFDAIGVVVDWIDACKQRRLDDLLSLYDATATVFTALAERWMRYHGRSNRSCERFFLS
jgi:hypothetical protein